MTRVAFWLSAALCAPAAMLACTSDDREEPARDDAGTDGGSLPETGTAPPETEASTPRDAATEKPPFDPKDEPVTCAGSPCAVELVAGERHFCARMADGTVRCWGDNTRGSLGIDDPGVSGPSVDGGDASSSAWTAPVVKDLEGVTQISAGGTTTCAIAGDAGVLCWGGNDMAQLGLASEYPEMDEERHPTPSAVALPSGPTRVDLGQATACALLESGEVWCWGDNRKKQLTRPIASFAEAPALADLDGLAVTRIAFGTSTGFAITTGGELVSWGAVGGAEGSVSGRETSFTPNPEPVAIGLAPVTSFSVSSTMLYRAYGTPLRPLQGIGHACAVVKGELFCWGDTLMGSLGVGLAMSSILPRRVLVQSETAWPQQVAAAGDLTCVRLTDGTVQCAGDNAFAALGRPPTVRFSTGFEPTEGLEGHAVAIAAAAQSVCALLKDGHVVCWGSNEKGELGQGFRDHEPHPSPVRVRF